MKLSQIIFILVSFTCLGLAAVTERFQARQEQYSIQRLLKEREDLVRERTRWDAQIAALTNPDRRQTVLAGWTDGQAPVTAAVVPAAPAKHSKDSSRWLAAGPASHSPFLAGGKVSPSVHFSTPRR